MFPSVAVSPPVVCASGQAAVVPVAPCGPRSPLPLHVFGLAPLLAAMFGRQSLQVARLAGARTSRLETVGEALPLEVVCNIRHRRGDRS